MGTWVSISHKTVYTYDREVNMGPQILRLRPAPHSRTPILSYSLQVQPREHFLNWLQDPYGNFLARIVFPKPVKEFSIDVDLAADLAVYNPFDFFLEPSAETYPFELDETLTRDLAPYRQTGPTGDDFEAYLKKLPSGPTRTVPFLVALNHQLSQDVGYNIRMEPNVQSPDATLRLRRGSCRDSALLLVELLRRLGFAARFVSGYLIQLKADQKPLSGPSGPEQDFTDLHAWAEAYVPGAGWIGLDPTSGLLTGEGHIPLAATPRPSGAAPVEGELEPCNVNFHHEMRVTRLRNTPRPSLPYPAGGEDRLDAVGRAVDQRLEVLGFSLTIGGEPTFVSETDRAGEEWNGEALGPTKRQVSTQLLERLADKWAPGGLLHFAQGKWYPGETLPRWALSAYWRKDGKPLWKDPSLLAREGVPKNFKTGDALKLMETLTEILGVEKRFIIPAYEDPAHFVLKEDSLPINVTPGDSKLADPEERHRLAQVFRRGLDQPIGWVLPLQKGSWKSGPWPLRSGKLILTPGDSPIGLRLPLDSLPWADDESEQPWFPQDPMELGPTRRGRFDARAVAPMKTAFEASAQTVNQQPLPELHPPLVPGEPAAWVVRTALCAQERDGLVHVFFPPMRAAGDWFALASEVEAAASQAGIPVILEGYTPPFDPEIGHFQITPDPGVIEVNLPPARTWAEWKGWLTDLWFEAQQVGLSTVKYLVGGQVVGTGGGCHWVLGGPTPAESPFLKRPDLLRSWIIFLNRHPSMSYLFSGLFVGPTSQAPRLDETFPDGLAEVELAFEALDGATHTPPWLVDRIFRNLLVDTTGNTHRTELCIDKLFSPDRASGRLGLVEFRAFEMAPHRDLALAQSLLLRALSLRFLEHPFEAEMERWGTELGDRWKLPHFLALDFDQVLAYLEVGGLALPREPFQAFFEFRFPLLGAWSWDGIEFELRQALEAWPVLGEEPGAGGTVRYVDSSVERVQIVAKNWDPSRYVLSCRGRQVPLKPQSDGKTFVAGIRFKAWDLPSGLHPTLKAEGTLIIDLVDLVNRTIVAGCTYHVSHPAGRNYEEPPVNDFEAEARRSARFSPEGHTPGPLVELPALVETFGFPHTLDVRKL
jgi:uncharacterized protein (DUF2126 family)/transglutaminase-like putative cysteine protease